MQFGSQYAHTRSCFAGYLRVDDSQVLYGTSRTATYEAHFVGVTLCHGQVAYRVPAAVKCSVVSLLVVVFLVREESDGDEVRHTAHVNVGCQQRIGRSLSAANQQGEFTQLLGTSYQVVALGVFAQFGSSSYSQKDGNQG